MRANLEDGEVMIRLLRISAITALVTALTACNGGLGKRHIRNALETSFGDSGLCWKLQEMQGVTFPLRAGFDPAAKQANAILTGLIRQKMIDVDEREESGLVFSRSYLEIELTQAGKDAKVWDPENGFCIGRKGVVDIVRWSEPAEQMGARISQVEYTWGITDSPRWLDKKAFAEVEGINTPVEAMAVLRKMSDGWQVVE